MIDTVDVIVTITPDIATIVADLTVIAMVIITSLAIIEHSVSPRKPVRSLVLAPLNAILVAISMKRDGTITVRKSIAIVGLATKGAWPRHLASLTTIALSPISSTPMWDLPIVLSPAVPPQELVKKLVQKRLHQ